MITGAAVFYEYAPKRYVAYWFFSGYSAPALALGLRRPKLRPRFGHEGDWERIVVCLDRNEQPGPVGYWQHKGGPHMLNGFGGAWGRRGRGGDFTGPLGPSERKRSGPCGSPRQVTLSPSG